MKVRLRRSVSIAIALSLLALLLSGNFFSVRVGAATSEQNSGVPVRLSAWQSGSSRLLYQVCPTTFKETNQTISGRFCEMWWNGRTYEDSLFVVGYPLTEVRCEVSPTDGKVYPTQWFQRARMELHQGNQQPYDVLFGLLGVVAGQGRQNATPFKAINDPGGLQWFPQTGHSLGDASEGGRAIAALWTRLGGLPQFGYPLSEPFTERSPTDGKPYLVQYFERQRLEYHPENKGTKYEVLLGLLGKEQLLQQEKEAVVPCP